MSADRLVIDDGRRVLVRALRHDERTKYRDAVAGLSARSRYLRFAAPLPGISEPLLDRMMEFDGERHVVYAAFTTDESTIVAVARFVKTAGDPRAAEVAIAVADDWQGGGLGAALMAKVVERAREADLTRLIATTLDENRGAARLARAVGFSPAGRTGIYADYELALGAMPDSPLPALRPAQAIWPARSRDREKANTPSSTAPANICRSCA
jgi:RimJ/RimL family protein N-acetyltransferase